MDWRGYHMKIIPRYDPHKHVSWRISKCEDFISKIQVCTVILCPQRSSSELITAPSGHTGYGT